MGTEKHILLVDEDAELAQAVAERLGREGYRVSKLTDSALAVPTAAREKPDLVIFDLALARRTGHDGVRLLKAAVETRRIPVLILTGFADRALRVWAAACPGDAFLTKPFEPEALLGTIERLLAAA